MRFLTNPQKDVVSPPYVSPMQPAYQKQEITSIKIFIVMNKKGLGNSKPLTFLNN
jgi:hypothetical protein